LDAIFKRDVKWIRKLTALDKMISGQRMINSRNSVFLILFKGYIVENDFDGRGVVNM
jgi:hypothetical protein